MEDNSEDVSQILCGYNFKGGNMIQSINNKEGNMSKDSQTESDSSTRKLQWSVIVQGKHEREYDSIV